MAETKSAPSLREREVDLETLNKAATPGRWLFEHMQGVSFAGLYSDDATGSIIAKFGGFEFAPRADVETDANCALAVALVNSYREGRMARAADAEHYMRLAGTWKRVAERAGVCMTCALGAPDLSIGCTDCLNTGWEHGAPEGLVREDVMAEAVASARAEGVREGLERAAEIAEQQCAEIARLKNALEAIQKRDHYGAVEGQDRQEMSGHWVSGYDTAASSRAGRAADALARRDGAPSPKGGQT